jgi:hypothetical protein
MSTDKENNEGVNFDDFVLSNDYEETLDIAGESKNPESVTEETETEEVEDTTEDTTEEVDETEDVEEEFDEEEEEEDEESTVEDSDETEETDDSFVPLIEAIHQHNGWEFNAEDFEDGSMEGLMSFFSEVIEANSRPEYASEETARFDEFVRRYGPEKAGEYLSANFGEVDYENESFESDESKKELFRSYLKETTKFSDSKIEKEVKKAEELGELDDEDNINEYKEHMVESKKQKAKAIEQQAERERTRRYEEYQNYLSGQKDRIMKMDEIQGVKLSDRDKEDFYRFAYEVGKDGKTGYQRTREGDKDLDLKLLWSAYADSTGSSFRKKVESSVAKKVKKNLSRYTDKASKKSKGVGSPGKKSNPNEKVDYNDFVLRK